MIEADPVTGLRSAVNQAAEALRGGEHTGQEPSLDRPPKAELGDYSSNAAMLLAAPLGEAPRQVAERIGSELERDLGDRLERIEVAATARQHAKAAVDDARKEVRRLETELARARRAAERAESDLDQAKDAEHRARSTSD